MKQQPIEINDPDINVEEIMSDIREKIRSRGYLPEDVKPLASEAVSLYPRHLNLQRLSYLESLADVALSEQVHSHRPLIGPVISLVKRLVRKLTYWQIEPMVSQQRAFNEETVQLLAEWAESLEETLQQIRQQAEKGNGQP